MINTNYSIEIKSRKDFEVNFSFLQQKIKKINKQVGWVGPFLNIHDKVIAILNNEDNPAFFLLLQKPNKKILAGYVIAQYKTAEKKIHVNYLAIHPDYARQGFGTKLMKTIFKLAQKNHVIVSLKHTDDRKLYEFYSRFKPMTTDSSSCLDFLIEDEDLVEPLFDPIISLQAIQDNYKPNKPFCLLL